MAKVTRPKSKKSPPGTLTVRQQKFVEEYLKDNNGMHAAIRAGFAKGSAGVAATRLLADPKVAHAVNNLLSAQEKRTQVTADKVIKELWKVAAFDIQKIFDKNGDLLPMHKLDPEVSAALSGVDVEELKDYDFEQRKKVVIGKLKKVKAFDKVRALEALGKHFRIFPSVMEVSGPNGGPIKTAGITVDLTKLTEEQLKKLTE